MNLHTPVVFSDDASVQALARERRWAVVERHPGNPAVLRIPGVTTLCTMPQPRMSISDGSLDAASAPTWNYVLNWLTRFVHKPLPVVAAHDYATELALWAAASRGWPIGALVHDTPTHTAQAVALFTSAYGLFIPEATTAERFTADWQAPVQLLENSPLVEVSPVKRREPARRAPGATRVLLTAYHAGPGSLPEAQHVNYWFEHMETMSEGEVVADLAVATPWPDAPPNVHQVPDFGVANLTADDRPLQPWAKAMLDEAAHNACAVRDTPGGWWHLALERYFSGTDDEYDVVICIGSPFGHFDFAHYAKRRWFARTILAYGEPFAGNPAAVWDPGAEEAATYLEAGWNMDADLVLAADAAAASQVVPGKADTRIEVLSDEIDEPLEPHQPPHPSTSTLAYSRAAATRRLISLVKSLGSHSFDPSRSWEPPVP